MWVRGSALKEEKRAPGWLSGFSLDRISALVSAQSAEIEPALGSVLGVEPTWRRGRCQEGGGCWQWLHSIPLVCAFINSAGGKVSVYLTTIKKGAGKQILIMRKRKGIQYRFCRF